MIQGVYLPPGVDPKLVALLERYTEALIPAVLGLLPYDENARPEDAAAQAAEDEAMIEAELCAALNGFLRYNEIA